jgi:hypothetical protein
MVEDYYAITAGWFELCRVRAEHAISECHRALHSMPSGIMEPPPGSQFTLSVNALQFTQKRIKQVIEVERMAKRFDQALRYARRAEDMLAEAASRPPG